MILSRSWLRLFLYFWTLLIYFLMWVPLAGGKPPVFGQMDLLIHFGLFLLLGGVGWLVFRDRFGMPRTYYWLVLSGFVALSAELGQYMFPTREVSLTDLIINLVAIFCGAYICKLEIDLEAGFFSLLLAAVFFLGTGTGGTLLAKPVLGTLLFDSLTGGTIPYSLLSVLCFIFFLFGNRQLKTKIAAGGLEVLGLLLIFSADFPLPAQIGAILLSLLWLSWFKPGSRFRMVGLYFLLPGVFAWLLLQLADPFYIFNFTGMLVILAFMSIMLGLLMQKNKPLLTIFYFLV